MNPYTTLTEALEGLISLGYHINFTATKNFINARNHDYKINYSELEIDYFYHFSDPDPKLDAVIYGISSKKHSVKGLIIISWAMFSENLPRKIADSNRQ